MKNRVSFIGVVLTLSLFLTALKPVYAHFQMILPSDDMVSQEENRELRFEVKFWHPYEGHGMNMIKPVQFGVMVKGRKTNLLDTLKAVKFQDVSGKRRDGFSLKYKMRRPGDHLFYAEPAPYWESAEGSYIIHYTKVVVNGFGLEDGWDKEVGLKTEIVPLTRPYGLYTGNVFQGIVKVDGQPVPFSEVEAEHYEPQGGHAEADPMITQVVKADANGVFTYAMPKAGWWAFAALNEGESMEHDGQTVGLEIGAVLWVKAHDMK